MSWLFASGSQSSGLQHQSFQWIFRVDFLLDWLVDLLAVQGILKSLQHHSSKASILQHSWLCWVLVAACGIFCCRVWDWLLHGMWDLVPRPGIKAMSPALEGGFNHWTIREVLFLIFWGTFILFFYSSSTNLHFNQQGTRFSFSPHPYQHVLSLVFLMIAIKRC